MIRIRIQSRIRWIRIRNTAGSYFVLLFQVDVYKEILSLEVRESEERPADDDNQLFRQVCDQLR
jgi:hypothetical protein